MTLLASILVCLVALLHVYILVLEMFLWTRPLGMKVFRNTPDKAQLTKVLAANQGLYNGFLAAGLFWALLAQRRDLVTFVLICVVAAGIYGAMSVSRRIFFVQGMPALLALLLVWYRG